MLLKGLEMLFMVCLGLSPAALASSEDFSADLAKAKTTAGTSQGSEYDRRLGAYFMSLPGTEAGMSKCLRDNPGPQRVEGFFRFAETGSYHLELAPRSKFSKCLEALYEGHNPPSPPSLPYLIPFSFELEE